MPNTTTELLEQIKLRSYQPDSGGDFTNAELLVLADGEIQSELFPALLDVRGDYRLQYLDVPLTAELAFYRLPYFAHGGRLADVKYLTETPAAARASAAAATAGVSLDRTSAEELGHLTSLSSSQTGSRPYKFYPSGGRIGVWPVPTTTTGCIRLWFYRRPSRLVPVSEAGVVTAVSASNGTVTCGGGEPTTLSWGSNTYELTSALGDGDTLWPLYSDYDTAAVASDVLTFVVGARDGMPSDLAETGTGFGTLYVSQGGETPVPNLPELLHPVLAQRVAVKVLEATGDKAQMQLAEAKAQRMQAQAFHTLQERIDGESKRAVRRSTTLRSAGHRRHWRFGA